MRKAFTFLFLTLTGVVSALSQSKHSPLSPCFPYEVRAVWLTTLSGLDWPSSAATTKQGAERQKTELRQMLDKLRAMGFNTVLFQSRIRSTTAYASAIEPWDGVFAGKASRTPLYDPLQFAVEECHKRGMECHAWVVTFPVGKVAAMKQLKGDALPAKHPTWCCKCGDQWMLDPGVPEVAPYLADICREIVENYDVDGIHLDYVRYPEAAIPFRDDRTYRQYSHGESKAAWRTANVNRCVKLIHDAVKAVRPWCKMSCSPVGKYSDLARQSSYGWNARDAVSQDAQLWLKEGWMDMLMPMMYFDGKHYYPFLADWKENDHSRPVVPGIGIYFLNEREKNWPLSVIQRQMRVARAADMGGAAVFRAKFVLHNEKGIADWLAQDFYRFPALTPPMTWLDHTPPSKPEVRKQLTGQRLTLTWQPVKDNTPIYYNVYRLDAKYGDKILATRLKDTRFDTLLMLPALKYSRYVVSAVDAYGNEAFGEAE